MPESKHGSTTLDGVHNLPYRLGYEQEAHVARDKHLRAYCRPQPTFCTTCPHAHMERQLLQPAQQSQWQCIACWPFPMARMELGRWTSTVPTT